MLTFCLFLTSYIYQENLDNFLKIAEEIQLKGLTEGGGDPHSYTESNNKCERNERKLQLNHEVLMDNGEAYFDNKCINGYNSSSIVESDRILKSIDYRL